MTKTSINNTSKGNGEIFVAEQNGKYYWLLCEFDELYLKKIDSDDLSFYSEIPKALYDNLLKLNYG